MLVSQLLVGHLPAKYAGLVFVHPPCYPIPLREDVEYNLTFQNEPSRNILLFLWFCKLIFNLGH
jgi:hypothetical protein